MLEQKKVALNWKVLIAVAAAAAVGFLAIELTNSPIIPPAASGDGNTVLEVAPVMGALAPDFVLENLDGENVRLSDFRGQAVLINLWATWCGPCRLEMPAIQSRYEKFRDEGFVVLAVNFDEPAGPVESFRNELGLTFPILLDPDGEVQKLYRNRSYPSSFLIDRYGVITVQHIGVMTEGQLDENLAKIGLGG